MADSTRQDANTDATAREDPSPALAADWLSQLDQLNDGEPGVALLPPALAPNVLGTALARLAVRLLSRGSTLLIVVADDELAPFVANALDPWLRPLCLMLPAADFAVGVVLRATLALLKNGLARSGEFAFDQLWNRQRQRVDSEAQTWQRCLEWSENADAGAASPPGIACLFPLRLVAASRLAAVAGERADFAVVIEPATGQGVAATRGLLLRTQGAQPSVHVGDDERRLRAQLAILSQELGHMEMELVTVQTEVGSFARSYHQRVGRLVVELDTLQAERAATAARRDDPETRPDPTDTAAYTARAERSRSEQARVDDAATAEPPPFRPSSDLKRLYRQVAQKIHPDRAVDEEDRVHRTALMSEANRAYRAADEAALRDVLARWRDDGADERPTPTPDLRLQLERLKRRLGDIQAELHAIFGSRLYELFVAARLARRRGRDLLAEMAADLQARIAAARQTRQ